MKKNMKRAPARIKFSSMEVSICGTASRSPLDTQEGTLLHFLHWKDTPEGIYIIFSPLQGW